MTTSAPLRTTAHAGEAGSVVTISSSYAGRVRRVDDQRMDYLRSHFGGARSGGADLEARGLLAFSAAIAST